MIDRNLLRRIEAFGGMAVDQLDKLQECGRERQFSRDERLFAEGDDATHLWFVTEGEIDLRFEMPGRETTREHTVSVISVAGNDAPAKTIGWSCFVAPFKMRLSAYCTSETCNIIRIEKEKLFRLFQKDPGMGYRFMSYMVTVVGKRFQNFQDYVARHMGEHLLAGW